MMCRVTLLFLVIAGCDSDRIDSFGQFAKSSGQPEKLTLTIGNRQVIVERVDVVDLGSAEKTLKSYVSQSGQQLSISRGFVIPVRAMGELVSAARRKVEKRPPKGVALDAKWVRFRADSQEWPDVTVAAFLRIAPGAGRPRMPAALRSRYQSWSDLHTELERVLRDDLGEDVGRPAEELPADIRARAADYQALGSQEHHGLSGAAITRMTDSGARLKGRISVRLAPTAAGPLTDSNPVAISSGISVLAPKAGPESVEVLLLPLLRPGLVAGRRSVELVVSTETSADASDD